MDIYGLIGKNLSHSFSAEYFNTKFKANKINANYKLFPIDNIEKIIEIVSSNKNLKGLNITIPYKESVIPFVNDIDKLGQEIGAINTIKIQNNKLLGYNTDAIGFEKLLLSTKAFKSKKALVLGYGGASKAVCYTLNELKIEYQKVSRTIHSDSILWEQITREIIKKYEIIINTTPLGMSPNTESFPLIPYDSICRNHLVIDLVYNPVRSIFLELAFKKGAKITNGLSMLYAQADAAWKIWNK
ncbi:MAG: hypothetical protein AUJ98_07705 [Bacteroidetes bacterium CG2_30_33_31]|nr:MAG: hypothetical protein AUJ98_07705 [Bacteroidetes bacterium CG2_30_33_31]